jgi:nitrogen regulatory protein PII
MKMVVVHVGREASESIRTEMLGLPLRSLSISEVNSPESNPTTLHYRGSTLTTRLRPEVKLECIVERDHVAEIVDTVLKHSRAHAVGERDVYVMALDEASRAPAGGSSGARASGLSAQRIALPPDEPTLDADVVAAR